MAPRFQRMIIDHESTLNLNLAVRMASRLGTLSNLVRQNSGTYNAPSRAFIAFPTTVRIQIC